MKIFIMFLLLTMAIPLIGETVYISVDKANLLDKPNLFAKKTGTLKYGDQVEVIEKKGAFLKVKAGGNMVYVHQSAISEDEITMASESEKHASVEEVSAATKGFNQNIEDHYKETKPELRYDLLDRGEELAKLGNFMDEEKPFRREGRLCEFKEGGNE